MVDINGLKQNGMGGCIVGVGGLVPETGGRYVAGDAPMCDARGRGVVGRMRMIEWVRMI